MGRRGSGRLGGRGQGAKGARGQIRGQEVGRPGAFSPIWGCFRQKTGTFGQLRTDFFWLQEQKRHTWTSPEDSGGGGNGLSEAHTRLDEDRPGRPDPRLSGQNGPFWAKKGDNRTVAQFFFLLAGKNQLNVEEHRKFGGRRGWAECGMHAFGQKTAKMGNFEAFWPNTGTFGHFFFGTDNNQARVNRHGKFGGHRGGTECRKSQFKQSSGPKDQLWQNWQLLDQK